MKKNKFTLVLVLFAMASWAQVPHAIMHQAVIRNAANQVVSNAPIGIQISILQGSADGIVVYSETHLPISNTNGLISFVIGQGTVVSGVFTAIDWGSGLYFIKTQADYNGGANYSIEGISQVLSVPYTLHTQTAKKIEGSIAANIYPPTVVATEATNIESFSATMNGIVNAEGFSSTVVFEWGTTTAYGTTTTAIQSPVTGSADVLVSADLIALQSGTTYHYRIKATNAINVSYSDDMAFTTQTSLPELATLAVSDITNNSAMSGGIITHDGGSDITARGVVWSTSENPTIANNEGMTDDGTGPGEFISYLTGLTPHTTYHVRAYATNNIGTAYGSNVVFKKNGIITDYDGNSYKTVIIGNQEWMAENLKTTHDATGNSITRHCYENNTDYCNWYGGLYDWNTMMNGAGSSNNNPSGVQGICPNGWHVPSDAEYTQLLNYVVSQGFPNEYDNPNGAGNALKSCRQTNSPLGDGCNTTAHPRWESYGTHHGFDQFGLSALPGGYYSGGMSSNLGEHSYWWSTMDYSSSYAGGLAIHWYYGSIGSFGFDKPFGLSVRCLKD